ncbi:MAG TPA: DUF2961 domain-containing protein [Methylomirabilota bacterium]|nr:DUF2961 domain-containing protein [Methylomirabilota bacterium]
MTEQQLVRGVALGAAVVVAAAASGCGHTAVEPAAGAAAPSVPERILPWEWWRDLTVLAVVPDGSRTVMRSSHCVSGGEKDRHSPGDSRFLRVDDDGEGVIFEVEGAGAVTRIWMVMGDGVSEPLDRTIRIRIRLDGDLEPVVDLPLPELFDGSRPPFVPPLVAGREASGGGHVSYVPIPFRQRCTVSLAGADDAKIWFQVSARLVDDPRGVRTFTGGEDLAAFRAVLASAGRDPWPARRYPTVSREVTLAPGGGETVASFEGPDVINGLIVRAQREDWKRLGLRITFDDRPPLLVPLLDLFGIARSNDAASRSLLFGGDDDDDLYGYFPMPFQRSATVELLRRPVEGPPLVAAEVAVRRLGVPPPADAGTFQVHVRAADRAWPAESASLAELDGSGAWVGLFASFGPAVGRDFGFLEADERVFVDGELEPSWHGTGVEDLFGGGFYFRDSSGQPQPFLQPLHGAPVVRFFHRAAPAMYRLLLGDAVVFSNGLRVELEAIEQQTGPVRVRSVAFYYTRGDGETGDRE